MYMYICSLFYLIYFLFYIVLSIVEFWLVGDIQIFIIEIPISVHNQY
jgi:hypothetical protein